jgi:GTP-binding protein
MFRLAIVGRPNVGKSTLFNKLVGKSFAITSNVAGTTRDRKEYIGNIADLEFVVIDTAGLEQDLKTEILAERMLEQTRLAISGADACFFLVDAKVGILPTDVMFANWLRKLNKPTQLLVNKAENFSDYVFDKEFYKLGFGKPVAISAEHKLGFDQLYYFLSPLISAYEQSFSALQDEQQKNLLQIAIIGRPNAGKSSLLNYILQENRLLTGPEAGITRDSISVDWQINGNPVRFIDTAGIRKKTNISQDLEKLSVLDSYRAIRFSQVVILLIDANTLLDHQDVALAGQVLREGRALIFAINKIDTVQIDKEQFIRQVRSQLQQIFAEIDGAPILGISAKNGYNVAKLLDLSWQTFNQWQTYLNTSKLCIWLQDAVKNHQPKLHKGISTKLKYATQIKSNPPTIAVFTNHIKAVVGDYQKYLVNSLREYFNLKLTPIRLVIRKSDNPFANKKEKTFSKKTHGS